MVKEFNMRKKEIVEKFSAELTHFFVFNDAWPIHWEDSHAELVKYVPQLVKRRSKKTNEYFLCLANKNLKLDKKLGYRLYADLLVQALEQDEYIRYRLFGRETI